MRGKIHNYNQLCLQISSVFHLIKTNLFREFPEKNRILYIFPFLNWNDFLLKSPDTFTRTITIWNINIANIFR